MRKKNVLWMCLTIPLFLSMTAVTVSAMTVHPPKPWTLTVIPSIVNGTVVGVGNTFTVDINITCGDLYGPDYRLSWNDTLIEYVNHTAHWPDEDPEGAWAAGKLILADKLEDFGGQAGVDDTYHQSGTALGAGPPFNGTMTLATITFEVLPHPVYAECNLTLHSLAMVGYLTPDITLDFVTEDGLYVIPEFPVALIAPLFMVVTIVAALLRKRRGSFVAK